MKSILAVLISCALLAVIAALILMPQHKMSRDFLVAGRRCLAAIEKFHDATGYEERDWANRLASVPCEDAKANRANDWDTAAAELLHNYATAVGYVHTLGTNQF